jgi:hypothetical protein
MGRGKDLTGPSCWDGPGPAGDPTLPAAWDDEVFAGPDATGPCVGVLYHHGASRYGRPPATPGVAPVRRPFLDPFSSTAVRTPPMAAPTPPGVPPDEPLNPGRHANGPGLGAREPLPRTKSAILTLRKPGRRERSALASKIRSCPSGRARDRGHLRPGRTLPQQGPDAVSPELDPRQSSSR